MQVDDLRECLFHLITFYNLIYETMLLKKFCSLESFRQLLSNCLLDDTWSCKSNQRIWLCQNDISQHGKTCGHSTCCRVCQHGNIKLSCIVMTLKCSGCFGHLHQGVDSLLHSGAAGTCKNNHRKFFFCGTLYCTRDFLADDFSHACHETSSVHHSFIKPCLFPQDLYLFFISLKA